MTMKFSYRIFIGFSCVWLLLTVWYWFPVDYSLTRFDKQLRILKTLDTANNGDNYLTRLDSGAAGIFSSHDTLYPVKCTVRLNNTRKQTSVLNTFTLMHQIDDVYVEDATDDAVLLAIDKKLLRAAGNDDTLATSPLQVFVLPHSHCDPGWIRTVDEYYERQVRHILNHMLDKLTTYPDMTFICAETVFFSMWWQTLDLRQRSDVKRLVTRGQLELVLGGWVVPDEANPHYFALIDQLIEGHHWLQHELAVTPTNSWSLDPFGYTSTLPYLYEKAGLQNMAILRVHQYLKHYLEGSKNLEFYWQPEWNGEEDHGMFTSMLPYSLYDTKHQCGPDQSTCLLFDFRQIPLEDSERKPKAVTDDNVDWLARTLLEQYRRKSALYTHNVLLAPIGDDFRFDRELEWEQQYHNYTKLFHYINSRPQFNAHIRFGTLNDYFTAVRNATRHDSKSHKSLVGDFFPYNDRNKDYWTGYYSTRAYDKSYGRQLEHYLRSADLLNLLAQWRSKQFGDFRKNVEQLQDARRTLALFQHHDAITGTSRAHVVIDMEQRMFSALKTCKAVLASSQQHLLGSEVDAAKLDLKVQQPYNMMLLQPTKDLLSSSARFLTVTLFNPLPVTRQDVVRVSIDWDVVEVLDDSGNPVLSQLNPIWQSATNMYQSAYQLLWVATLPALSLTHYTIHFLPQQQTPVANFAAYVSFHNYPAPKLGSSRFVVVPPRSETVMLENQFLRARLSARSGLLKSITSKTKLSTLTVFSELMMYKARKSGAYIFEPTGPATDTEMLNKPQIQVTKGPVLSELRLTQRNDVITHTVGLYNCTGMLGSVLEINNVVDMSKFDDHELILRLTASDLAADDGVFYADLNGFNTVKRQRFRNLPRWSSYYPMSAAVFLDDGTQRVSLLSAQPLGVSSQERRSVEVMLDRRLLYDDGRGLGEGVRDSKRTPSRFYLLFEIRTSPVDVRDVTWSPVLSLHAHALVQVLQQPLIVSSYSDASADAAAPTVVAPAYNPLQQELHADTSLISLRSLPYAPTSAAFIIHKLAYDCSFPTLGFSANAPSQLNVDALFKHVTFKTVKEMSLSLIHEKDTVPRNTTMKLKVMELYAFKLDF